MAHIQAAYLIDVVGENKLIIRHQGINFINKD
jgi:hypothetical protein